MLIESEVQSEQTAASAGPRSGAVKRALPDIQPGRIIAGKFRLTRQLGRGGMGTVWAAVHETLGREVAVKFLQPPTGATPLLTERFVSEAHMVASLKHRFIVDVFDFGITDDGLHYMVLELLHGRSLADRIDHGPPMSVRQAVRLMADFLRGLHVVHEAGSVHRDLKPDNVFVIEDADGQFPKLIDFGISRRTDANLKLDANSRQSRLTQPGTVLGTPFYMSPEQLRGKHNIDRRADLYGVGVILFELLAGKLPFTSDNVGDLMVAITITGAPLLFDTRPELGEALSAVVKRALAPLPDQRYATALELRAALLELLPQLPEEVLCATPPKHPAEFTLSGESHSQPMAAAEAVPSFRRSRFTGAHRDVPVRVWVGLASFVALAALAWSLAEEIVLPSRETILVQGLPAESGEVRVIPPRAAPVLAAPIAPMAPTTPAPEAASTDESAANSGTAANQAKAARAKARPRDPATAPPRSPERPQKLYRKLDF
ncbi:MAG: serine/threonine-protein kinase [Polyangiales bacterium]